MQYIHISINTYINIIFSSITFSFYGDIKIKETKKASSSNYTYNPAQNINKP